MYFTKLKSLFFWEVYFNITSFLCNLIHFISFNWIYYHEKGLYFTQAAKEASDMDKGWDHPALDLIDTWASARLLPWNPVDCVFNLVLCDFRQITLYLCYDIRSFPAVNSVILVIRQIKTWFIPKAINSKIVDTHKKSRMDSQYKSLFKCFRQTLGW